MKKLSFPALLLLLVLSASCGVSADSRQYQDVPDGAWFADAVRYVSDNGYFTGLSDTLFSPASNMTRGMFVTVLGRMANVKASNVSTPFSDIGLEMWYAPYVAWAAENGLASGYNDNTFRPGEAITKEQAAALLWRYFNFTKFSIPSLVEPLPFSDTYSISDWALEPVQALHNCGVFSGDAANRFFPQKPAARAEVAAAVYAADLVLHGQTPVLPVLRADEILSQMTLEEKIYQLFVTSPEKITGVETAVQAGETTKNALAAYPVGGIMYSAKNLETPQQVKTMLFNTQSYAKLGLFLSVDEEGGNVARVQKKLGTTKFEPMFYYRDRGPDCAYFIASTLSRDIAQFGFNQDYAPVADIWTNPQNTVISTRALSDNPHTAAELVGAAVKGFRENHIISTLKHFPGHGDTSADTHTGLATTAKTLEQLRQTEFLPFAAGIGAGADFVMVAHITASEIDDRPATMSSRIMTGILREEMNFQGVIITDAMEMGAITNFYSSQEASVNAFAAGADMLLSPQNLPAAAAGIRDAVNNGTIPLERLNQSVKRILNAKLVHGILQ